MSVIWPKPPSEVAFRMRVNPEEKLQMAVVQYLRLCYPQCVTFAIPNEGNRGALGQKMAITKGLLPGLHDLCVLAPIVDQRVPFPDKVAWIAHFIELKTPAGPVSQTQRDLHAEFEQRKIEQTICRSVDDVAAAMRVWGIMSIERTEPIQMKPGRAIMPFGAIPYPSKQPASA